MTKTSITIFGHLPEKGNPIPNLSQLVAHFEPDQVQSDGPNGGWEMAQEKGGACFDSFCNSDSEFDFGFRIPGLKSKIWEFGFWGLAAGSRDVKKEKCLTNKQLPVSKLPAVIVLPSWPS